MEVVMAWTAATLILSSNIDWRRHTNINTITTTKAIASTDWDNYWQIINEKPWQCRPGHSRSFDVKQRSRRQNMTSICCWPVWLLQLIAGTDDDDAKWLRHCPGYLSPEPNQQPNNKYTCHLHIGVSWAVQWRGISPSIKIIQLPTYCTPLRYYSLHKGAMILLSLVGGESVNK